MKPEIEKENGKSKKEKTEALEAFMVTKDNKPLNLQISKTIRAEMVTEFLYYEERIKYLLECKEEYEKLETLFVQLKQFTPKDKKYLFDELDKRFSLILKLFGENRYCVGFSDATKKFAGN